MHDSCCWTSFALGAASNEGLYYLARFAMLCFFMVKGYLILSRDDSSFTIGRGMVFAYS